MLKLIIPVILIFFSCSFTIPSRDIFSVMSKEEREEIIKETWNHRNIFIKSSHLKHDEAVDEFFDFFCEMLILDRDLCQKETK